MGNVLGILRRVMNLAMQEGLLENNVASKLGEIVSRLERSHASEVRQVEPWTREAVAAILDLAREKEPRAYPVLHVLLSSGMRRSEALGLQWRDVDWSRHKIHVRRSRVRDRTGTPKSGRARQVDMSRQLEAVLRGIGRSRSTRPGTPGRPSPSARERASGESRSSWATPTPPSRSGSTRTCYPTRP